METVYITQENCTLHRCSGHLILRRRGDRVGTIPLEGVKTLVLLASVEITAKALDLLFDKNIDVIYTSRSGRIKGRINAQQSGGAVIRLAQHSAFINPEKRIIIARTIVGAKVRNQLHLIQKYKYNDDLDACKDAISKIESYLTNLPDAKTLDEIMGIEGISAKVYWECYRRFLREPLFNRREYRPAPDIINSALNLGYSFLATEITTCLAANKFDIEIGFLHSIHYGRNSLTLDIMEEFRSPFVDAWILYTFNRRELNETHFKGQDAGFYLNDEGFSKFCTLYHEHIDEGNWRRKFRTQADNLKKYLLEGGNYVAYEHE